MRYSMSFSDWRERIEVLEFEAASDSSALKAARRLLLEQKRIFRADHPRARVREGWYVLWIVLNVDSGETVYTRPRSDR